MLYNAAKIAEQLNISKVTAYAKMKLPEIKPLIILQDGKSNVDEKGFEAIKQALKYNTTILEEIAPTSEIEELKTDMIKDLKSNNEFLKEQLAVKDIQFQDIKKLFENTQTLLFREQDKNKVIFELPRAIKEHDIELVNTLKQAMERQKERYKMEFQKERLNKKNKFFSFNRFFKKKNADFN